MDLKSVKVRLYQFECKRCGHKGHVETAEGPKACPKCKNRAWRTPRRLGEKRGGPRNPGRVGRAPGAKKGGSDDRHGGHTS